MSIHHASYVACDACGDPCEISTNGAKDARIYSHNDGWRRVVLDGKARDICPRHDGDSPDALLDAVRAWCPR